MSDQQTPPDEPGKRVGGPSRRRAVLASVLRSATVSGVVLVLYFTLPFDEASHFDTGLALLIGLIAVAALSVWQARRISHSPFPVIRALEGLITTFPLVILLFATTYFVMAEHVRDSFNQSMTRIDALYFTVTTFATVGYGDIVPTAETARVAVTVQMVIDLALIGLVARAFVNSARTGLARRDGRLP
jgi:hypothetical protein